MWYSSATPVEIIGTLLIIVLFVVIGIINLAPAKVEDHIVRARNAGMPFPAFVFWFGIALEFVSCALILVGWHPEWGALGLLVFMVFATGIYIRFWTVEDLMRRNIMRNAFFSNVAIIGGILLLYENLRV